MLSLTSAIILATVPFALCRSIIKEDDWSLQHLKSSVCSKETLSVSTPPDYTKPLLKWKQSSEIASGLEALSLPTKLRIPLLEVQELEKLEKDENGQTTIITLLYENKDEGGKPHKPFDLYVKRFRRLVRTGAQMLVYTSPELKDQVEKIRDEEREHKDAREKLVIVTDFKDAWSFPGVERWKTAFQTTELAKAKEFQKYEHQPQEYTAPSLYYSTAWHSALFYAKLYILIHAVTEQKKGRWPFKTSAWLYNDAGLLAKREKQQTDGVDFFVDKGDDNDEDFWNPLIKSYPNEDKIAKVLEKIGPYGVALPVYKKPTLAGLGPSSFANECWRVPNEIWRCNHFIANILLGSSAAMVGVALKFFQTMDEMWAAGLYVGREELVFSFLAARYPKTFYAIQPIFPHPVELKDMRAGVYPFMLSGVSGYGGEFKSAPALQEPVSQMFCAI